jgi:LuxR family maltose regulon positive regulatory protein
MAALLDDPAVAAPLSDATAAALAEVAVIRVNLAMGELDLAKASRLARAILPHLEIAPETFLFNRPDDLRAVVEFTSGLVELYSGQLDGAAASLQSAWRLAQGQGNVHLAALAVGNLASLQLTRGQFRQAERTCEIGAQALAEMPWSRSPMTGVVHAHWGAACYVKNDLASARAHYLEAIRFAKPWANWEALLPGYLGIARLGRAEGDWTAAFEALDDMERHVLGSTPAVQAHAEAVRALYRAELGDSSLLDRWLNHHRADFDSAALPVQEDASILLARLLHVHGDDAAAAEMLSALLAGAEAGGRWGRVIEILVLQALVHASAGRPALAQAALARALRLAQPEDALRPFLDAGQPMVELLKHARRAGVTPDLCRRLLAAFAPQAEPEAGPHPAAPLAAGDDLMLLEPLTEREREVLALLAQGLSNKAIARTLVLTEGTVKAHAHTIYAKLAVNTRTEAVAQARRLAFYRVNCHSLPHPFLPAFRRACGDCKAAADGVAVFKASADRDGTARLADRPHAVVAS